MVIVIPLLYFATTAAVLKYAFKEDWVSSILLAWILIPFGGVMLIASVSLGFSTGVVARISLKRGREYRSDVAVFFGPPSSVFVWIMTKVSGGEVIHYPPTSRFIFQSGEHYVVRKAKKKEGRGKINEALYEI